MVRKAEELECWQLADKLRAEVIAICEQPKVARHFRFCDGFTDAAGSVCRNMQEGFDRRLSTYIVQYFEFALGSLKEVMDYLHECTLRKFIDTARFEEAMEIAEHAKAKAINFKRFHEDKLPAANRRRRNPGAPEVRPKQARRPSQRDGEKPSS